MPGSTRSKGGSANEEGDVGVDAESFPESEIFGCPGLRMKLSRAKFDEEADFDVRSAIFLRSEVETATR